MSAARHLKLELPRPHNVEVEQQLLGALLLYNGHIGACAAFLRPEHFVEPLHSRIYEAILSHARDGRTASPFTLKNSFEDDAGMSAVGGTISYLADLARWAVQCLSPTEWAKVVLQLAVRRNVIAAGRELQDHALRAPLDVEAGGIIDHAEGVVAEISAELDHLRRDKFESAYDVAARVIDDLSGATPTAVTSYGLTAVNDLTGGMRGKELVILAARPGMGKTAVAAHIARKAALHCSVAFFSMEMGAKPVMLRMLTAMAFDHGRNVAYEAVRKGAASDAERSALIEAQARYRELCLRIHDGRNLTPTGILASARREQRRAERAGKPLGLVVVDHIQKIRPDRDMRGNKVAEMTEISDALQKLAGTLDVPVLALSQLNRAVESRPDKKPELYDLRESGSIEQDADAVLLLYREAYYLKKDEPAPGTAQHSEWYARWVLARNKLEIHVAKNRNGQEGTARVFFDAPSSALKD